MILDTGYIYKWKEHMGKMEDGGAEKLGKK